MKAHNRNDPMSPHVASSVKWLPHMDNYKQQVYPLC